MRTFWIILGVLVLVGIAAALLPGFTTGSSKPAMNSSPVAPLPEKKEQLDATSALKSPAASNSAKDVNRNTDAGAGAPVEVKDTTKQSPVAASAKSDEGTKPAVASTDKPSETKSPSTSVNGDKQDVAKPTEPVKSDVGVQDVIETALNAGNPPAPIPAPAAEGKVELKQTPVKIERKEDGSVVLDGQFTVKGNGTKESPYIAPWELVLTAQETYDPGQKKDEVPGAVMFLDGKHVRLTGYVCFPMYVPEPKEMLAMLNQWDGCCIGVPPSPYDAVEVHLSKKVGTDDRYAVYGTVEGVFHVKPYLSGNWLIGLYLLEDATFKPSDKGGGN